MTLLDILIEVGDRCPFQVVVCDTASSQNPIVYANSYFCMEFEIEPSKVLGMTFDAMRGPLTAKEDVISFAKHLKTRKPFYQDIVNYRQQTRSHFLNRVIVLSFTDRLSIGIQITLDKPKVFPHSSKTIGDKIFNALHLISLAKELGDEGKEMILNCLSPKKRK